MARLYVVSDILHNSSASVHHAWKYRAAFEHRLGDVFLHFNDIYRSFSGRILAEKFRLQVSDVLTAWESWLLFVPSVLESFNRKLVVGTIDLPVGMDVAAESNTNDYNESNADAEQDSDDKPLDEQPSSGFKPVNSGFKPVVKSEEKVQLTTLEGHEGDSNIDIDGVPISAGKEDMDVDGAPIDDVDGAPIDDIDVDGVSIEDDVDADIDGEPM